jgi:16S rRNA (cytosine967-C5)-methyltransferase
MNRSVKKGQSPRETALIIMHQVSEKCAYANLELNKVLILHQEPLQQLLHTP